MTRSSVVSDDAKNHKQTLRAEKKRARRALTPAQQSAAAVQLARRVASSLAFIRAQRVALYWPFAGEISPLNLLQHPQANRKQWYLPVIRETTMEFFQFQPGAGLGANRFGIMEPDSANQRAIKPWQLDLILVPLVAFDAQKHRLGMGGGFYDRYLSPQRIAIKRPYLLGVGHQVQEVAELPLEPWDVRLDAIATDQHWY